MERPKGNVKFDLYRDMVKVRCDRPDPVWNTKIEYDISPRADYKTLDFDVISPRKMNEVKSKYPFRQNLCTVFRKSPIL